MDNTRDTFYSLLRAWDNPDTRDRYRGKEEQYFLYVGKLAAELVKGGDNDQA